MPIYTNMLTSKEEVFEIIREIVVNELFLDRTKQQSRVTLDKKLRQNLRASKEDVYMIIRNVELYFELKPIIRWRSKISTIEDLVNYVIYASRQKRKSANHREYLEYDCLETILEEHGIDENHAELEMYPEDCWDWKDMDPEMTHDDKWDHLRVPLSVFKRIIKFWFSFLLDEKPYIFANKMIELYDHYIFEKIENAIDEIFPYAPKAIKPKYVYDRPGLPVRKKLPRYKHRIRRKYDMMKEFQQKRDEEKRMHRIILQEEINNSLKKIKKSLNEFNGFPKEIQESIKEVKNSLSITSNSLETFREIPEKIKKRIEDK